MSQVEIVIREGRMEDSNAIAAILRALGWFEHINNEAHAQTRQRVATGIEQCQREKTHTVLVAERVQENSVGKVVGYVSVHWFPHLMHGSHEGYISELFVHPSETGKGIGGRLLKTVNLYARERDCTRLLLMNRRTRESYQRGFYMKHGWEESPDGVFFSYMLPQREKQSEVERATVACEQASDHR